MRWTSASASILVTKEEEKALFESSQNDINENEDIIVTWGNEWHEGVIGIVASRLAKKYKKHLLLEPLKGTYPGTLEEVVKLQEQYGERDLHLCLKNTEINHDDFYKYIDRVKNCHISFELFLKYRKELENLTRFTLEI